jgi:hypothetical protein
MHPLLFQLPAALQLLLQSPLGSQLFQTSLLLLNLQLPAIGSGLRIAPSLLFLFTGRFQVRSAAPWISP